MLIMPVPFSNKIVTMEIVYMVFHFHIKTASKRNAFSEHLFLTLFQSSSGS